MSNLTKFDAREVYNNNLNAAMDKAHLFLCFKYHLVPERGPNSFIVSHHDKSEYQFAHNCRFSAKQKPFKKILKVTTLLANQLILILNTNYYLSKINTNKYLEAWGKDVNQMVFLYRLSYLKYYTRSGDRYNSVYSLLNFLFNKQEEVYTNLIEVETGEHKK